MIQGLERRSERLDLPTVAHLSTAADLKETIQGIIGWWKCQGEMKNEKQGNLRGISGVRRGAVVDFALMTS
jgi:hypothetical protein